MRHDITIDRKQVRLPNVALMGYSKTVARIGYVVFCEPETYGFTVGRVIGRIASGTDTGNKSLRDFLVVIALGSSMTFPMERWIDPVDVIDCYDPKETDFAEFLREFFALDFKRQSVQSLRDWATGGTVRPSRQ